MAVTFKNQIRLSFSYDDVDIQGDLEKMFPQENKEL